MSHEVKHKQTANEVVLFGLVGVATVAVDTAVSWACYHMLGFSPYTASAIGFLSGFVVNFPLNRKRVFKHSENDRFSLHTQIVLYALLSLFNLFATSLIVGLLVNHHLLPIQFAKLVVTAVFAIWNFVWFKVLIFSKITMSAGNSRNHSS